MFVLFKVAFAIWRQRDDGADCGTAGDFSFRRNDRFDVVVLVVSCVS